MLFQHLNQLQDYPGLSRTSGHPEAILQVEWHACPLDYRKLFIIYFSAKVEQKVGAKNPNRSNGGYVECRKNSFWKSEHWNTYNIKREKKNSRHKTMIVSRSALKSS